MITYTSKITKKTNVNHRYDMDSVNVCSVHKKKPNFVYPNKKKDWVIAECDSEECVCFAYESDIVEKWNRFHPEKL